MVSLCDVHAEYDDLPTHMAVGAMEFRVVLSASQVVSLDAAASGQLSLLKEA
ncbi:hypothetical protein EBBID32_16690 [Sphingobium indicum BiD32]|uniref:Uncharacterized protein n=1 Tax=Sphingobium indicum BiD32 TaxID=1301087 RepID=N1MJF8_9SPHN|nr:hypothetical protein EBBID32_16690 [Sphingobium indicum BiD32]